MKPLMEHCQCLLSVMFVYLGLAGVAGHSAWADSDWQQIGLSERPSWVSSHAERRLRLLPALAAIQDKARDEANAYFADKGPGLSVGLVLDDGLYYSHGYGFRDLQKKHKPDEYTVFGLGSFSKVITGTTLLVLRDAGKLSLGDLATKYVPELKNVRNPPCPHGGCSGNIKLRNLVSHTSGLPNEMHPAVVDQDDWLSELKKTKLNLWPGTFSAYSGVSAETVGLIIERVSGKSFRTAAKDLLLKPLGMTHSTFAMDDVPDDHKAFTWKCSLNASHSEASFTAEQAQDDGKMLAAAGAFRSSVSDMGRFARIWLAQKDQTHTLKDGTLAAAETPLETTPSGTTIPSDCATVDDGHDSAYSPCSLASDFGVNWYIGRSHYLQHNGSTGLNGSQTLLSRDRKLGAVGLVSTDPLPSDLGALPAGIEGRFVESVVENIVDAAGAADAATTKWKDQALSVGVARYLYIAGLKIPRSMRRWPPPGKPGVPLHPGGHHLSPEDEAANKRFKEEFLAHFTPGYLTKHDLDSDGVADYLSTLRNKINDCSTFRVRSAPSAHKVALRLLCTEGSADETTSFDVTLTVEASAPYRISELEDEGRASEKY